MVFQREQFLYLGFHEARHGDMRPLRDDASNVCGVHLFLDHTRPLDIGQLRLDVLNALL